MEDRRKVQTAVLRDADSYEPVAMPMDRQDAERIRDHYANLSFWCGTWLGGCGQQLTTKIGRERVPHFAHYPDSVSACHRRHTDIRSADHLYVHHDISNWLKRQGKGSGHTELFGDFQSGGTCSTIRITTKDSRGAIVVEFREIANSVLEEEERRAQGSAQWLTWLFPPGSQPPERLLARDGYTLHYAFANNSVAPEVKLGTRSRFSRSAIWTGLNECSITEHGITTPDAEDIRRRRIEHKKKRSTTEMKPKESHSGKNEKIPCGLRTSTSEIESPPKDDENKSATTKNPPTESEPLEKYTKEDHNKIEQKPLLDPGKDVDVVPLSGEIIDYLERFGCTIRGDAFKERWLRIASMHRSYHYESGLSRIFNVNTLKMLAETGKRWIKIAIIDRYIAKNHPRSVGEQNSSFANIRKSVKDRIAESSDLKNGILLGRGETGEPGKISRKILDEVSAQVIGMTVLTSGSDAVYSLVDLLYPNKYSKYSKKEINKKTRESRNYRFPSSNYIQVIHYVKNKFELPKQAEPLLTRALTHSSWAHENQDTVKAAGQEDNAILAHHGSIVADVLVTHSAAASVLSRTLQPSPEEVVLLTPKEETWRDLFDEMSLSEGLLLGAGQRRNPEVAYANAMQAILAVAWRNKGPELVFQPPNFLDEWARSRHANQDQFTQLQQTLNLFGVRSGSTFEKSGPDHSQKYAATIELTTENDSSTIPGTFVRGRKSDARQHTALYLLNILDRIKQAEIWDLNKNQEKTAKFLLREQMYGIRNVKQSDLMRCAMQGHLGMRYLLDGDLNGFAEWSKQAEILLGEIPKEHLESLSVFYHRCRQMVNNEHGPRLHSALNGILMWAEGVAPGEVKPLSECSQWRILDAVSRTLKIKNETQAKIYEKLSFEWPSASNEQQIINIPINTEEHATRITADDSRALAEILHWIEEEGKRHGVTPELDHDRDENGLTILISITGIEGGTLVYPLANLVEEQCPNVRFAFNYNDIFITTRSIERPISLIQVGYDCLDNPVPPSPRLKHGVSKLRSSLLNFDQSQRTTGEHISIERSLKEVRSAVELVRSCLSELDSDEPADSLET
ncbi:dsRNA-specific ribonuclease [Actinopolyspora lacussalsi]|nr:dsRNA-specific ribonuclease [Actinopolyspora lacussalsi]